MTEKKSTDLLGLAPYGEALSTAVKKSFEGIEGFLKSVCMPALDEVGLMLKDKVRYWRLCNILRIIEKSQGKLEFSGAELQIKAHPRVALAIIENGSVIDNDEVQELWAGLFASSCTKDGQDDENLIFVDLLKQLTTVEAKILKFASQKSRKIVHNNGLVLGEFIQVSCEELFTISGITDVHRLDRELDHLRSMDLIGGGNGSGGFYAHSHTLIADITPTALALNLYIRSQGSTKSPTEYWKETIVSLEQLNKERQEQAKKAAEQRQQEVPAPKDL